MKVVVVKPNKSGKVRTNLCAEDVSIPKLATMIEFEMISMPSLNGEQFLVFKEPIPVPKFNKFYASRIRSVNDPYLQELFKALLYLNPSPDLLLRKKIVEFIVMRFSKMEMKPSQVRMHTLIATPILTFEKVEAAFNMFMVMHAGTYEPTTGVYVLFSNASFLSKETKMQVHRDVRAATVKVHLSTAVHIVAEHLMDTYEQVKITTSKIENTKMVTTSRGPASVRSITKYMSEATKRDINDHNVGASFKSYGTFTKYQAFLEHADPEDSLDKVAVDLGISKSTAVEFKRVRNASN